MLNWVQIDESYTDYLRENGDSRIPYTDYGADKFKPFFGVLFAVGDLYYVTQVSHPQQKHVGKKNSLVFYKVFDLTDPKHLIAVVHLNYMFPVHKSLVKPLTNNGIRLQVRNLSARQQSKYIDLMRKEMRAINTLSLEEKAMRIYRLKYDSPNYFISQLCLDFKNLERVCRQYMAEFG